MFRKSNSRLRQMLADNISKLRKGKRLDKGQVMSQANLAKLAGVSIGTIQKVESAATWPDWKTMVKIANVLSVDVDDLYLGGDSLTLPKALEIVNRELGIDLRPGRPKLKMDKDFFFQTLELEANEVKAALSEAEDEKLNELMSKASKSLG